MKTENIEKLIEASRPSSASEQTPSAYPFPVEDVLDIALDIGAEMLKCGGEVHRVEDTMTRICKAYGASEVEVFVITSLLIAQIRMPDDSYSTQTHRIYSSRNHLARLEEFNALSREICREPIERAAVTERIAAIKQQRPVPEWLCYVGGMLATGGFALFFGGTWLDGLAAAVIGLLLTFIERSHTPTINAMAKTVISAFIAGSLAMLCTAVGFGDHVDKIIIGTIMLEIPGMSFGNSLRDLLCGDTLAGTMRFIQAVLQALIMAVGYLGAMLLFGRILGV